jgi:hypothetical protein
LQSQRGVIQVTEIQSQYIPIVNARPIFIEYYYLK